MKRPQGAVPINASQLLAAITFWLAEEGETFYEAAKRLNVSAIHVGASKKALLNRQVLIYGSHIGILEKGYRLVRLTSSPSPQSHAASQLERLLGPNRLAVGEVYDLDLLAAECHARLSDSRPFLTEEMKQVLRAYLFPERSARYVADEAGEVKCYLKQLDEAVVFVELVAHELHVLRLHANTQLEELTSPRRKK